MKQIEELQSEIKNLEKERLKICKRIDSLQSRINKIKEQEAYKYIGKWLKIDCVNLRTLYLHVTNIVTQYNEVQICANYFEVSHSEFLPNLTLKYEGHRGVYNYNVLLKSNNIVHEITQEEFINTYRKCLKNLENNIDKF